MGKQPGRPRIELPSDVIIREYNQGVSVGELAGKYHVAYGTMRTRLHAWGIKVRQAGPIPERDRHRYGRFTETGNRESNPGEVAESNPGVSENPPSPIDVRRQQILELEEKIAAGKVNLQQAYERKEAYERKLATLKGLGR